MKVEEIKKILVIGSGTMGQKSGKGFMSIPIPNTERRILHRIKSS